MDDITKNNLKSKLLDYIMTATQATPKGGKNSYICPLCLSGSGPNATGAFFLDDKAKLEKWHCFACGQGGDIFDLYGAINGISDIGESFRSVAALFEQDTGLTIGRQQYQKQARNEQYTHSNIHIDVSSQNKVDYTTYYKECQAHINETDYPQSRGLSQTVIEQFRLGFDKAFTKGTGGKTWQALIIPTGKSSYIARNIDLDADSGDRYRKQGPSQIYNRTVLATAEKPIFVVEGELDALSIATVHGEVVALGSTSGVDSFLKLLKEQPPVQPLILALDNDEKGQNAADKLADGMKELGITFYRPELYVQFKDANEALLANKEAFAAVIDNAEHIEEAALQAERELHLQNSAGYHLRSFLDGITDDINTQYIPTGFKQLDEVLDGGLYEGLYILGSITSNGKTTMAMQLIDQIAQSSHDVIIFSMEMSRYELMSKSISRHTIINVLDAGDKSSNAKTSRGITTGRRYTNYTNEELALIHNSINDYGEYANNIIILEGLGDIGVGRIRDTVKNHILFTGRNPVVFVDYLQILAPYSERMTDKQNTDKAVLELKRISRDFKIPVFCVSSLNRANYKTSISMEAFKESGAIEYSSDVLLGLQLKGTGDKEFDPNKAKSEFPREMELIILKNRNGRTGDTVEFRYYPLFNYFEEKKQKF